jgi:dihydroorotate dehydrogenase (fumarate)
MRHGIDHLRKIECEMVQWMERHGQESVAELKGRLSQHRGPDPAAFERAQYLRTVGSFCG